MTHDKPTPGPGTCPSGASVYPSHQLGLDFVCTRCGWVCPRLAPIGERKATP